MYVPGGNKTHTVWVEADLNGKELGRWPLNFDGYPAAFTETGEVYGHGLGGVYVLDRAAGNWKPTSVAAPGALVGAAGQSLVFAGRSGSSVYRVTPN